MGDVTDVIAERYRLFARHEAAGRSASYEEWALRIADDSFALQFLRELPEEKQQPNLLFAAVRHVCGTASDWVAFRALLQTHKPAIRQTIMLRATQTNEPARCAILLPVLAQLPQPLALLEIGASAGLCLLPDYYSYRYSNGASIGPQQSVEGVEPPVFSCEMHGAFLLPTHKVEVAWRRGVDVQPIDLRDAASIQWLQDLVWPDEGDRLSQLRQALAVARQAPASVQKADVRFDLQRVIAEAMSEKPSQATLVVFHSAVLPYLAADDREMFLSAMAQLPGVWISNESIATWPVANDVGCQAGDFVLRVNGVPVACADPHGRSVQFVEGDK